MTSVEIEDNAGDTNCNTSAASTSANDTDNESTYTISDSDATSRKSDGEKIKTIEKQSPGDLGVKWTAPELEYARPRPSGRPYQVI